jgi:hypothetical protein
LLHSRCLQLLWNSDQEEISKVVMSSPKLQR